MYSSNFVLFTNLNYFISIKQCSQRANKLCYSFLLHSPSAVKTALHFHLWPNQNLFWKKGIKTPCLDETSCLGWSLGLIETSAVTSTFIQPYSPDKSQQRKQAVPHRSPASKWGPEEWKMALGGVCGKVRDFLQLFWGEKYLGGTRASSAVEKVVKSWTKPHSTCWRQAPSSHTSLWDTAVGILIGVNYRWPPYWHTGHRGHGFNIINLSWNLLGCYALKLKGLWTNAFHKMCKCAKITEISNNVFTQSRSINVCIQQITVFFLAS